MGGSMKKNLMYLNPLTGTYQLMKDVRDGMKMPDMPRPEEPQEPVTVEDDSREVEAARLRQAKKKGRASTLLAADYNSGAAKRLLGE